MAGEHSGYKFLADAGTNGDDSFTGVGVDAFIGKLTEAVNGRAAERATHDAWIAKVWPLPLTPFVYSGTALAAALTTDARDIYGPKDGWAWDLRFTQLAATGGTLDLYLNQPSIGGTSDPNSLVHITAAGFNQTLWGSGIVVLQPGDRFVMVAGTSTTLATCMIHVVQVPLQVLGEYLM